MRCQLPGDKTVSVQANSLILSLPEGSRTLATSRLNGGYRDNTRAVINSTSVDDLCMYLSKEDYEEYYVVTAEALGLDPERSVGLGTAVRMENAAIVTESHGDTTVTAIVTAGVEGNGGRAGDPSSYDETVGYDRTSGTIVIILVVEADLPEHAMLRAVMTATEAKTCALQQLMAESKYSHGIATGSGTDQIAVVANGHSDVHLTDAGKHSKLGELIGRSVLKATLEALNRHGGLNPAKQMNALRRLQRFGIDEKDVLAVLGLSVESDDVKAALADLRAVAEDPVLVAAVTSILHIQDELAWNLLPKEAASRSSLAIIKDLPALLNIDRGEMKLDESAPILENLVAGIAQLIEYDSDTHDRR
jgi:adenosylcobinamide hydrolase